MAELVKTRVATLADVAEFVRGITFKPNDIEDGPTDKNVDCLRTKNVQASLDTRDVWAIDPSFVKRPNQYVTEGDILISSANSWNLVGKCSWIPQLARPTSFGGFVTVLRRRDDTVDSRYLFHWFSSDRVQRTIRSFGNQTTNISNLDLKRSASLALPLPPIAEQRRIAAILNKVEDLRTKRRTTLAHCDALVDSMFQAMFSAPDIRREKIGNLVKFKSGSFLPASGMVSTGGYSVYGGNGVNGKHDQYMFAERKLVIGRVGANCGVVHVTGPKSWITDNALYVESIPASASLEYLATALRIANLNQYSSQSGQPLISGSRINQLEIALPAFELQEQFSDRVSNISRLKNRLQAQLTKLDALFASLQHRAFKGEL